MYTQIPKSFAQMLIIDNMRYPYNMDNYEHVIWIENVARPIIAISRPIFYNPMMTIKRVPELVVGGELNMPDLEFIHTFTLHSKQMNLSIIVSNLKQLIDERVPHLTTDMLYPYLNDIIRISPSSQEWIRKLYSQTFECILCRRNLDMVPIRVCSMCGEALC